MDLTHVRWIAGGTGAGNGLVAVGSADGQVVVFAAVNGAEKWRANVKGEGEI